MKGFFVFYYVLVIGFYLPYAALRQVYKKSDKPLPPKAKLRVSVIITLAMLGFIALCTAYLLNLSVFPVWRPSLLEIGAGVGLLVFWLAARLALLNWLRKGRNEERRLLPETWDELPMWGVISLSAGFFEEIVYRGVLYQVVAVYTGSPLLAGFFTSLSFAIVHIRQRWRAALFIFFLAAAFQTYVVWVGNLYMAMIVHAAYDFIVGILTIRHKLKNPSGDQLVDDVPEDVGEPEVPALILER